MPQVVIARVDPKEDFDFTALRTLAESEGYRFLDRAEAEWNDRSNRFDRPGEALFVARQNATTVGVAGLNQDPFLSDPSVGRLRRVYVIPAARNLGIGRRLVVGRLDAAVGHFDRVRLNVENPVAARLYESLGFERVDEPHASYSLTVPNH